MPRRRVMQRAVLAAGLVLASGCHGRNEPANPGRPAPGSVAQTTPAPQSGRDAAEPARQAGRHGSHPRRSR